MQIDEKRQALRSLRKRFGYMFAGPNLGLEVYPGWLPDFIAACERIDALLGDDKRGFHFSQIKEKYGWARYYFETSEVRPFRLSMTSGDGIVEVDTGLENAEDVIVEIAKILHNAEERTMTQCLVCGVPATIQTYSRWLCCACDAHRPDKMTQREFYALIHLEEPSPAKTPENGKSE